MQAFHVAMGGISHLPWLPVYEVELDANTQIEE